ncbi:hypothetical protein POM88_002067 [Heracleum sosnowskyi]|uniref:Uncharacterized protein n=1 Tax=Heracleum sosnowskyi TaxID=360622 RepID=A0AAD8JHB8_9APIA|nr:hypothetical protein POM88_002067 [Heracleum sosnowskyi]
MNLLSEDPEDPRCRCNYCGIDYACHSRRVGISSLWGHLEKCKNNPHRVVDKKQKVLSFHGANLLATTFNKVRYRNALANFVVKDEQTFRVVVGVGFKELINELQPKFIVPSRITVARDINHLFSKERLKLNDELIAAVARLIVKVESVLYSLYTCYNVGSDDVDVKEVGGDPPPKIVPGRSRLLENYMQRQQMESIWNKNEIDKYLEEDSLNPMTASFNITRPTQPVFTPSSRWALGCATRPMTTWCLTGLCDVDLPLRFLEGEGDGLCMIVFSFLDYGALTQVATPKPQKETKHVLKVPQDPNVLEVLFLKNPSWSEFYNLVLTFKPSFPLNKIKCPDEISGDPPMCIHGLFNLSVYECAGGYLEGDMKVNKKPFDKEAPVEPLTTLVRYKDLFDTWWSCLGTITFDVNEKFLAYQENKHNFERRYPKDVLLLNGLVLGKTYVEKFQKILEQNHYMVGQKYNCVKFITDIKKGFQVSVEVNFMKLDHKSEFFGL